MNPIRPAIQPPQPQQTAAPDAARLAAQRAFFAAAMGQAPAAAAPAPTAVATLSAPVRTVQRTPDPAAEAPTRILRPGSLLDIRV